LLVSLSGVVGALVLLGFSFNSSSFYTGHMALASLVLYVAFFALGKYGQHSCCACASVRHARVTHPPPPRVCRYGTHPLGRQRRDLPRQRARIGQWSHRPRLMFYHVVTMQLIIGCVGCDLPFASLLIRYGGHRQLVGKPDGVDDLSLLRRTRG
jgi:hypothetical protein